MIIITKQKKERKKNVRKEWERNIPVPFPVPSFFLPAPLHPRLYPFIRVPSTCKSIMTYITILGCTL